MKDVNKIYDTIIVGGGPAGLSCAIYMARAKYKCLVLEKRKFGGLITVAKEVVNYPGIHNTTGTQLAKSMLEQAENFGAEFLLSEMTGFKKDENGVFTVFTDKGEFETLGLVLATGAAPKKVGFKGEEDFKGRGVAYCATCDGEFFINKDIYVIGDNSMACEEALFLTRFGKNVFIVAKDELTCSEKMKKEIEEHQKIKVLQNAKTKEVFGENFVQGITIQKDNEELSFKDENGIGVFVFAGYSPANTNFEEEIAVNEKKYIITDKSQKTSIDGVYAAGDICVKDLKQVVTAVSDGATAATSLEKYVEEKYAELGLEKREITAKPAIKKETVKEDSKNSDDSFISSEIRNQLQGVFEKFENSLVLKYKLDSTDLSKEVKGFMEEFKTLTPKVVCEEDNSLENDLPCISIYDSNKTYKGVSFHGVPGGHEFNSFIIGLYNAQGTGQVISQEDMNNIKSISKNINIKIAVTLSCTNCPDLVVAAEKIALLNENITLDVYDLSHYSDLKSKHNIMSVPCMIINDEILHFGKKNINQILDVLKTV